MLPPQSGDGNLTSVAPTTAQDGGHPPGTLVPIGAMYPHPGACGSASGIGEAGIWKM